MMGNSLFDSPLLVLYFAATAAPVVIRNPSTWFLISIVITTRSS